MWCCKVQATLLMQRAAKSAVNICFYYLAAKENIMERTYRNSYINGNREVYAKRRDRSHNRHNKKRSKRRKHRRRLITTCFIAAALLILLTICNLHLTPSYTTQFLSGNSDSPWNLILVNRDNPLPRNYDPELIELSNGESVDSRIYPELQAMMDDARLAGYDPEVVSGYRTSEKQQQLLDEKISEFCDQGYGRSEAKRQALQWVAEPGTSEHQLGLAVDINGSTYDTYLWLEENCCNYGFIYRYPADKTDITGIAHEEWHYRYVGKEAATEIHRQGICLEEYLWK